MGELLHAGALAATALSACCVAGSGRRPGLWELALVLVMFGAMADVVLGWGLLARVWWAAALVVVSMLVVTASRAGRSSTAAHPARATDALGGILMAALLVLMPTGGGSASVGYAAGHGDHGGSSAALAWIVVAGSALFAAASFRMGMPQTQPQASTRVRFFRRAAPLAMASSMVLMAAAVLA